MMNIEYYIHSIPEAVSGFRKRFLVIRDLMIHGPVETFYYIPSKIEVAPEAIKLVQLVRAIGAKPDNLGWVPGVWWKE